MEESKTESGASVESNSGATTDSGTEEKEPVKSKHVPLENHKRALDDMHKFKSRAGELEAKLNAIEEERLRETQNFKALADKYKAEAEESKQKLQKWSDGFTRFQKLTAIQTAALEAGLRTEAVDDLEGLKLDSIEVEETSSGRYILHGVKDMVEDLKGKKPHWFKKETAPKVNSGGGGAKPTGDGKVSMSQVLEAERKAKRGQISKEQYHEIFRKYASQK